MPGSHLTRELLHAIFEGKAPPSDLIREVMAHLFHLCPECQAEFKAFQGGGEGEDRGGGGEGESAYASAYQRALARALDSETQVEKARSRAASDLQELLEMSPETRLERILAAPERFQGPALAQLLLHESRKRLPHLARESYALAQLARAVLQHSPSSAVVVELYVRAQAYMANALRIVGELREAAERLDHARFLLRSHGGVDRLLHAELDRLEGGLCRARRRLPEAIELLAGVVLTYREEGETLEAARALLTLGMTLREAGDLDRAQAATREALQSLDPKEHPQLVLMARHNLATFAHEVGDNLGAQVLLEESGELYDLFPDSWTQLRRRWLGGQIAHGLGDAQTAEESYVAVRDALLHEGNAYTAAIASLDLAMLYLEQGRSADVKRLAEEIVPICEAQDVHREALAALMLFQDAARLEQLSLHFVRELAAYLDSARHNPALAFRQPS